MNIRHFSSAPRVAAGSEAVLKPKPLNSNGNLTGIRCFCSTQWNKAVDRLCIGVFHSELQVPSERWIGFFSSSDNNRRPEIGRGFTRLKRLRMDVYRWDEWMVKF